MAIKGLNDLNDEEFARREPRSKRPVETQEPASTWPSREPVRGNVREPDGALSIKGPASIIDRFKAKTNNGRDIKYYQMLDIMMNFCERNGFNARLEMMTDEERKEAIRLASTYK